MNEHKKHLRLKDRYECVESYGAFMKSSVYTLDSLMNAADSTILMIDRYRNPIYLNAAMLKDKFKKI